MQYTHPYESIAFSSCMYLSNGSGYRSPTATSSHQAFDLISRCSVFNLLMLQRNVCCFELSFPSLTVFGMSRSVKVLLAPVNILNTFNVYGSVHRKYISIYIQQDASLHSLFISGNCSTCFGWYLHPSPGAHTTVSTASAICHTVMNRVKLLIKYI